MHKECKIIHGISLFLHGIFDHPITGDAIRSFADDIAKMVNIGQEIEADTKNITDPAEKVKAICQAFIIRATELPTAIESSIYEQCVIGWCQKLVDLPLEQIEAAVKAEFGK